MIKNFENYTKRQAFANGFTQWEKTYDDGQTAWVFVDDERVTRTLVRSAFMAQEDGQGDWWLFSRKHAEMLGYQS